MRPAPTRARGVPSSALRTTLPLTIFLLAACNRHVFEISPPACSNEDVVEREVGTSPPLDLLIVVDNSGSMLEEQQNLRDNFYDPRCPFLVPGVPEVPEEERNPTTARLEELSEVCGFIQILGAYDRDWRLGVITTDVSDCDNRFGLAPDGHGRRPQRGCLQSSSDGRKVLESGEEGIEVAFPQILEGIGTWGSPVERGLDAVLAFLDDSVARDERCAADLESFVRAEAELAVVVLTDEDDCSQLGPLPPGQRIFDDGAEYACDIEPGAGVSGTLADPAACYDDDTALTDVAWYVERLRALKPGKDVQLAVIGGALSETLPSGEVEALPAGCLTTSGAPAGGCFESRGLSNYDVYCGEEAREGLEPCCQADAAHRYFAAGDALGAGFFGDSICYASFRDTLVRLASFIGRTDSLLLGEAPVNPAAIIVRVKRAGSDEEEVIEHIEDESSPEQGDGWWHAGADEIRFVGPSAPGPGDVVTVSVLNDRPPLGACEAATGPSAGL